MPIRAHCVGYPCIGKHRQWAETARKSYALQLSTLEVEKCAAVQRRERWLEMKSAGISEPPSNDFTLDNHVLDMAVTVGAVPDRYRGIADPLARYWAMAQGEPDWRSHRHSRVVLEPLPRRQWFDTLYSCSVPQLDRSQRFALDASSILGEIAEARALGIETRPVILGPITFLLHSHVAGDLFDTLTALLPVYEELLVRLAAERVSWVQLDEPCLVLDLDNTVREAYRHALAHLSGCRPRPKLLLTTYFGSLGPNLPLAIGSGCEGLHIDLVSAPEQREAVTSVLGADQVLSLGVIDGRNVFRNDLQRTYSTVRCAIEALRSERVWVAPSCSLRHVPLDVTHEDALDDAVKDELVFAAQKLIELRVLAQYVTESKIGGAFFEGTRRAVTRRGAMTKFSNLRIRMTPIHPAQLRRSVPFFKRRREQRSPVLQALLDVDALTPDAPESDSIEHWAGRLEGFAVSRHGWVQIDGLRCVRPPILHSEIARREPISTAWESLRSAAGKPVKATLPGPMTVFHSSFRRTDVPSSAIAQQLARALREELEQLQSAGVRMIQFDEPLLHAGPARHADREMYWRWAVDAVRLAVSGANAATYVLLRISTAAFFEHPSRCAEIDADVLLFDSAEPAEGQRCARAF